MKALSFSRMFLVLALVLGITVVWAGAAPSTTDSKSLLGGWVPYSGCTSCYNTGPADCNGYALWGCDSAYFVILLGPGSRYGEPYGGIICNNAGGGNALCTTLHHSCCGCCTP